jgi:hypothetical protein
MALHVGQAQSLLLRLPLPLSGLSLDDRGPLRYDRDAAGRAGRSMPLTAGGSGTTADHSDGNDQEDIPHGNASLRRGWPRIHGPTGHRAGFRHTSRATKENPSGAPTSQTSLQLQRGYSGYAAGGLRGEGRFNPREWIEHRLHETCENLRGVHGR